MGVSGLNGVAWGGVCRWGEALGRVLRGTFRPLWQGSAAASHDSGGDGGGGKGKGGGEGEGGGGGGISREALALSESRYTTAGRQKVRLAGCGGVKGWEEAWAAGQVNGRMTRRMMMNGE